MNKKLEPMEALCYLDDIAHGRKMKYDPHELKLIIEGSIKEQNEVLRIIKEKKLMNYVLKNYKCAHMYYLNELEINLLKEYFK